ncbi:MAG: DUF4422 domain-containing protein [Clostridia bacterium]|nr:DUF4422 domain-containing protein [Clostridia bacterium]
MEHGMKVIIATHKRYDMPQDGVYLPVQAGALGKAPLPYQSDAQGEHISGRNDLYCELTALYWAWKNLPAGALGLAHYRRYFGTKRPCAPWAKPRARIAGGEELAALLERTPVILPRRRDYVIENRKNQYIRAHGREGYDALRETIAERAPAYLPAFDASMRRTAGHCFNMFIMRRDLADAYCTWMFDILFAAEERMRRDCPQAVTPRLMGFLSERLMDCYIETNGYAYAELPVVHMEGQNWPKKAAAFLARKFGLRGRKG